MPARKRFGQHFLHDKRVIQRIIDCLNIEAGETVVEIGPGRGALTVPLLAHTRKLYAVELDRELAATLEQTVGKEGDGLRIFQCDVLDFELSAHFEHKVRLVGNLPYNISTPLLFHFLEQRQHISDMTFMLQKEIAKRIVAAPGGKDYGRLSVMVQAYCETEHLFDVAAGAFQPPPKVVSSLLHLRPRPATEIGIDDPRGFATVVRLAFSQRRKTLRNALKTRFSAARIEALGIAPASRAEQLSVDDFVRLGNAARKPGAATCG